MSAVAEHFERLQAHLAMGQVRAVRLTRLLALAVDEDGRPSVFVLPMAHSLLSASLIQASDAAADVGIELGDIRWTAVVTLLHNAGTHVRGMSWREALSVAKLLQGLQVRAAQLRQRRSTSEPRVRLS
jgi:hypothetical protein